MKFCPNCGKEIKPNAKFCSACGYVLASYQAPGEAGTNEPMPNAAVISSAPAKEDTIDNPFENVGTKEPRYSDYTDFTKQAPSEPGHFEQPETKSSDVYSSNDSDGYTSSGTNGYAIASLVCGILSFPLNFLLFIPGILAIIFGIVGLNRSKETGSGYGLSMAGLILGIVFTIGYIILIISAFYLAFNL